MIVRKVLWQFLPAALLILSVAFSICVYAQDSKTNKRATPVVQAPAAETHPVKADDTAYSYEFSQPDFYVKHVLIEHDGNGRAKLTFERQNEDPVSEQLEISTAAMARIVASFDALDFLASQANYQSEKQFPHLGTVRITMRRGDRKRTAEFNWTHVKAAADLRNEYRRIADQAMFVFDMSVARQNQPLNAPKLLEGLEALLRRNEISDPQQLVPLLKEITTDEHLPLIARNHAGRLLKKITDAK